jgi:hypothetical protein
MFASEYAKREGKVFSDDKNRSKAASPRVFCYSWISFSIDEKRFR